ncbi:hypothetical protein pipiens_018925 [Culex pipiens pipiens]|uniref:Uncharacterized protein n=1 Tax=Culex pipiens pipiens TaxID=38569 RepID=A0ABD1DX88_CULPP
MAESDLKTNSLKIRFAGNCREPTEPEIFDFMRGKMKLKADHLLSMYKDKLDASVIVKFKNEEEFKATLARLPGTMEFAYNNRGSYSAAVAGGAARWFKQKMAEPTLSKEKEATMTNLNALFPQTALMKPQQSMVEVKEKAPPAGPSSGKQITAAKETDDLWSQALAAVADQLQQPQQENKQDGDGWRVVPPKKEKNKKNPKKVRSSSAGSSGASGSVDPKFLRPRTPRPTAISDAQRNRDRSRSAPKNGDSKKPKIIVTAETNEEAKQPSSGEMDVDGVDEMKVAGSGGGQGAGGEQGTGGEQGCGGEVLDDVSL